MMRFCYLIMSVVFGAMVSQAEVVFDSKTSLPQQVKVDTSKGVSLKRDERTQLPVIEVSMNGKTALAILDTGATHTILDAAWVKEHFPETKLSPDVRPGMEGTQLFWITECKLGGTVYSNFLALVMDLSLIRSELTEPVQGIIGLNLLATNPFIFNAGKGTFRFISPATRARLATVPLRTRLAHTGLLTVDVTAAGRTFTLMCDTGCSQTAVSETFWREDPDASFMATTSNVYLDKKAETLHRRGVARNMTFAPGVTLESFQPVLKAADAYPYGLLGADVFEKYSFLFDIGARQVEVITGLAPQAK